MADNFDTAGLDEAARQRIRARGNSYQNDTNNTADEVLGDVGGALGGVIGAIYGGPAGAMAGWNVGKQGGQMLSAIGTNRTDAAADHFVKGLTGGLSSLAPGKKPALVDSAGVQASGAAEGADSAAAATANMA